MSTQRETAYSWLLCFYNYRGCQSVMRRRSEYLRWPQQHSGTVVIVSIPQVATVRKASVMEFSRGSLRRLGDSVSSSQERTSDDIADFLLSGEAGNRHELCRLYGSLPPRRTTTPPFSQGHTGCRLVNIETLVLSLREICKNFDPPAVLASAGVPDMKKQTSTKRGPTANPRCHREMSR